MGKCRGQTSHRRDHEHLLYQSINKALDCYHDGNFEVQRFLEVLESIQSLLESDAEDTASDLDREEDGQSSKEPPDFRNSAMQWQVLVDQLHGELAAKQQLVSGQQASLTDCQTKLEKARREALILQERLDAANQSYQLLTHRVSQLEDELEAAQQCRQRMGLGLTEGGSAVEASGLRQYNKELRQELTGLEMRLQKQKEKLDHEVRTWRLAADQAASIAEKAQAQAVRMEGKMEEATRKLAHHQHEAKRMSEELRDAKRLLTLSQAQLVALQHKVISPLLTWSNNRDLARERGNTSQRSKRTCGQETEEDEELSSMSDMPVKEASLALQGLIKKLLDLEAELEHVRFEATRELEEEKMRLTQLLQARQTEVKRLEEELGEESKSLESYARETEKLKSQVEALQAELSTRDQTQRCEISQLRQNLMERHSTELMETFERGRQLAKTEDEEELKELKRQVAQLSVELQDVQAALEDREKVVVQLRQQLEQGRGNIDQLQDQLRLQEQVHQEKLVALARENREQTELAVREALKTSDDNWQIKLEAALQEKDELIMAKEKAINEEIELAVEQMEGKMEEQQASWEKELQLRQAEAEVRLQEALHSAEEQWMEETQAKIREAEEEAQLAADKTIQEVYDSLDSVVREREDLLAQIEVLEATNKSLRAEAALLCGEHPVRGAQGQDVATLRHHLQIQQDLCRQQGEELLRLRSQLARAQEGTLMRESNRGHPPGVCPIEPQKLRQALAQSQSEVESLNTQCDMLKTDVELQKLHAAKLGGEVESLHRALDQHKSATLAAEAAAEEAWQSASHTRSLLEEHKASVALMQEKMRRMEEKCASEVLVAEARARCQMEAAQAEARAELDAAQGKVQLLRMKQQRLINYVSTLVASHPEHSGQLRRVLGDTPD